MNNMIEFERFEKKDSIIKVVGVGGGGSNAVNHMFKQGIQGVEFMICNTDAQALDISPVPIKIQLGSSLTDGRGAGSLPEVGKNAAIENIEEIRELLSDKTKMLFITAGMGGGTGTGAAPVIAAIAKELGILTVAIVSIPFAFEGRKRKLQAEQGLDELRRNVDTLLVISNDKLRELHGNLKLSEAFAKADNILTDAAKGIAEIITVTGYVNVDFEDVKTVMKDSGVAIMGTGRASGEKRALRAVEMALTSPLLNDSNIKGARNILLYMASGSEEMEMDEVSEITDFIQDEAGLTAEIIWGNGYDESLNDEISITVIATGFETNGQVERTVTGIRKEIEKKVHVLEQEVKKEETPVFKVEEIIAVEEDLYPDMVLKVKETTEVNAVQNDAPFEFSLTTSETIEVKKVEIEEKKEIIIHSLDDENSRFESRPNQEIIDKSVNTNTQLSENEAFVRNANQRISKLRELSTYPPASNPKTLAEIEATPAYIRRGVNLGDTPASNENATSRYTLDSETGEMRTNNTFLHDNVD